MSGSEEQGTGAGAPPEPPAMTRCGFVALVGVPNAGKSTLLNALVGTKVSIVTRKAQTTRAQIRGVVTKDDVQMVFIDTPGIFKPKRRLDRAMVHSAWSGAADADSIAFIVDAAKGITEEVEALAEGLSRLKCPKILVLNKIDRVRREALLALAKELNAGEAFDQTFMISALNGDGMEDLVDYFSARMPFGPFHFPPDQISDLSLAITAAEVTREKLFERMHEEIPYAATVETERFEIRKKDGSYRIEQVVYVGRESHKRIVLGKGGQAIKAIGVEARADLTSMFGVPVHLFLFVKVREKWTDDPARYAEMGLEYPK
ncbi:MAG: GTPase Era [Alphaproteobacteria bacterium]|nr:GTPase Era [Alphaproteobacteria bacterium]